MNRLIMPTQINAQRTGAVQYDQLGRLVPQPQVLTIARPEELERLQAYGPLEAAQDVWNAPPDVKLQAGKNLGRLVGNTALDFLPGIGDLKSAQEAITGTQPMLEGVPGVESHLTIPERIGAGIGALPFVPNVVGMMKGIKGGGKLIDAAKTIGKGEGRIPTAIPEKAEGGTFPEVIGPFRRYSIPNFATTDEKIFNRVYPGVKPTITDNVGIVVNKKEGRGFSLWSDGKIFEPVVTLPNIGGGTSESARHILDRAYYSDPSPNRFPEKLKNLVDATKVAELSVKAPQLESYWSPWTIDKWRLTFRDGTDETYFIASRNHNEGYVYDFYKEKDEVLTAIGLKSLTTKALPNPTRPPESGGHLVPPETIGKEAKLREAAGEGGSSLTALRDSKGEILTLYHGTDKPFSDALKPGWREPAIFLTPVEENAWKFARGVGEPSKTARVMSMTVDMKNPLTVEGRTGTNGLYPLTEAKIKELQSEGYDGIIALGPSGKVEHAREIIPFSPNQIHDEAKEGKSKLELPETIEGRRKK